MNGRTEPDFTQAKSPTVPAAFAHPYPLTDKIVGALQALRQRLFPRRDLVAGPYAGELGHELMEWQAVVRARVPAYQHVHVITYPGRAILYPGCIVHTHAIRLEQAGYRYGRLPPQELRRLAHEKARELGLADYDVLLPLHTCTQYHRKLIWNESFVPLHEPPAGGRQRDVAFHFRAVDKAGPDKTRNYPTALADALAARCRQLGWQTCCIGHPRYAHCPAGVEDLRSPDLQTTVAALCSTRLVVGELSGPIHLAQLCRRPVLIWAAGRWRIEDCRRWNIFGGPVIVVADDTFRPAAEVVAQKIAEALGQLPAG